MASLQSLKRPGWAVREPTAPELQPDEVLQAVFDEGIQVGEVARSHGPGNALIDLPYHAYAERMAATGAALHGGTPVLNEASCRASQVDVSVGILGKPVGGRQRHPSGSAPRAARTSIATG
jgi:hypothetical protein